MTLQIYRQPAQDGGIVGKLAIDGVFECFTLEGVATQIPVGTYRIAITHSHRFDRDLPELLDVPGRTGIRIHSGNVIENTEGCLLVGRERGPACVAHSREAFDDLFAVLRSAGTSITVTIEDPPA